MAFVRDAAADAYLSNIRSNADEIHICSAEPSSFANVASVTLGKKTSPAFGSITDGSPNGRAFSLTAFSDGEVTDNGTASHWALVDAGSSELLATGELSTEQAVVASNSFSLSASQLLRVPDAVAAS